MNAAVSEDAPELAALDAAHDFHLSQYARLDVEAGLLPPRGEIFGGLRHLFAGPRRRFAVAELSGKLPATEGSLYDSHPSVAERVRLIAARPDDGRGAAPQRPAPALLPDAEQVLMQLEDVLLTPEALATERVERPELAQGDARAGDGSRRGAADGTGQRVGRPRCPAGLRRHGTTAADRGALAQVVGGGTR